MSCNARCVWVAYGLCGELYVACCVWCVVVCVVCDVCVVCRVVCVVRCAPFFFSLFIILLFFFISLCAGCALLVMCDVCFCVLYVLRVV